MTPQPRKPKLISTWIAVVGGIVATGGAVTLAWNALGCPAVDSRIEAQIKDHQRAQEDQRQRDNDKLDVALEKMDQRLQRLSLSNARIEERLGIRRQREGEE